MGRLGEGEGRGSEGAKERGRAGERASGRAGELKKKRAGVKRDGGKERWGVGGQRNGEGMGEKNARVEVGVTGEEEG